MVDTHLPMEDRERPLRWMFLDLNSYFATVEQQERPELRGRPVVVAAVDTDSTMAIAASYEAKAFGVKTGTGIRDARQMCPDLTVVTARPNVYVAYHNRILEVTESVLPVQKVCSIDEMRFQLIGSERQPARARELAQEMKRALRRDIGECIRCSIGIAPNPFLAKIGTELQKPDGLVIIQADDLPQRLFSLKLTDFTGINRRMAARLNANAIFSAEDLTRATREELRIAFGSVIGERWWYLLRGFELPEDDVPRKSLGHSHVLAPELRTDQGAREVLMRLLQKASARLRATGLYAGVMVVHVRSETRSWEVRVKLEPTQDTVALNDALFEVWANRDFLHPKKVGVTFYELKKHEQITPSLFSETADRSELMSAVDTVNAKFGKNKIYLAGMQRTKDAASEKIAFQKTDLFSEGKGDHDLDTFRGLRED